MTLSAEQQLAKDHMIFRCMAGSRAYGTNVKGSDTDIRGIFIAPPEYTLGCVKTIEQVKLPEGDTELYELAKFVNLARNCNPNIIELLFTEPDNVLYIHPSFAKLRENRHLFLCRRAKHTFSGYAAAQLHRIKGHKKWIAQPQDEDPPTLIDFAKVVLPDGGIVESPDRVAPKLLGNFLVKVNATVYRIFFCPGFSKSPLSEDGSNIQHVDVSDEKLYQRLRQHSGSVFVGTLVIQEDAFRSQHKKWKQYWEWKKCRNPQRAELEEKYTFDVKHAMHLIRLLRMGKEILSTGDVIVRRPDAKELLDIRNGKFNYEELVAEAEALEAEMEVLYKTSKLPFSADVEAINKLYMQIVTEYWRDKGLTF